MKFLLLIWILYADGSMRTLGAGNDSAAACAKAMVSAKAELEAIAKEHPGAMRMTSMACAPVEFVLTGKTS